MIRIVRAALCAAILACALTAVSQQSSPPPVHRHAPVAQKNDEPASKESEEKVDPRTLVIRENNFGVALMNRQQFEKALGKFQRACILDPETDIGCLNTGIALLNMQQFDHAREILEKSAQRNPRDPHAWFNLGLLEKATGNSDAAIA